MIKKPNKWLSRGKQPLCELTNPNTGENCAHDLIIKPIKTNNNCLNISKTTY